MEKRILKEKDLKKFRDFLMDDEKSVSTLDKYMRDLRRFVAVLEEKAIDKQKVLTYKNDLKKSYAVTSANSMLASINSFLRFMGWHDLCVKQFKVQKNAYSPEEKELTKSEYRALVKAASDKKDERLSLVIQTICSTGIRVSELQYVTVEAVKKGEAVVSCKGKTRRIFFVSELRKKLLSYINEKRVIKGCVFVTKTGKAINRSNVWREMKSLCADAGFLSSKVFPHNLRHLFARTFYSVEKDIAKLADILGRFEKA